MNIFIDTNIYLTFYHLSSDDLEELKKLAAVIDDPKTTLYISDQVVNEYKRNRENKIGDALKHFQGQKFEDRFPQMCKDYDEYKEMRDSIKNYYENKSKLREKLFSDISNNTLKADVIINDLISKSKRVSANDKIIKQAQFRMELGNPPGKRGSLGDAINWEILLSEITDTEDLYFISGDQDYMSPLNKTLNKSNLSKYLLEEWKEKKSSNIFFYRRLSEFLNEKFPDIKLASEMEKEIALRNFTESINFKMTHSAIRKLLNIESFTSVEVNEIVDTSIANEQISLIIGDTDVKQFLSKILTDYKDDIESDKKKTIVNMLIETEDEPF